MMAASKRTARLVGAFFLFSNVVFIVGAIVFLEPILSASDYLAQVSAGRGQVVLGALLELSNAFAYLGIGVLMFPIFKKRFESLALAYVGFRVLEFVAQIISDLSPLALLTLSEAFVNNGGVDPSAYQAAGQALLASREWAFQMVSITFGSGAILFYIMLYRQKLIPRFISIWGLVGAAAVLVNTVFDMFAVTIPNLGFLMLLNEVFLGLWLIVKGFDQPAGIETQA
jgi:hypothetical protein